MSGGTMHTTGRHVATSTLRLTSRIASRLADHLSDTAATIAASSNVHRADGPAAGFAKQTPSDPANLAALQPIARRAIADEVTRVLDTTVSATNAVGLIIVDIDQFAALNSAHGIEIGDEVLIAVAARLKVALRPSDMVIRLGADEFAAVCPLGTDRIALAEIAHRIHRCFDQPISTSAGALPVSVSMGTATASDQQGTPPDGRTLLRQAETATQVAKRRGRAELAAFDLTTHAQVVKRYRTEHELRSAVANHDLEVHYQPVVNLHSGNVVGIEALARWNHRDMGAISPSLFIPVAEESGLIHELGAGVLASALDESVRWQRPANGSHTTRTAAERGPRDSASYAPTPNPVLMVNLSSRQLMDPNLIARVRDEIDACQIAPGNLCLEITESVVMNDVASSMTILGALKDLGVVLAIDDFGTGYSSLSYLRRLPVDILKIDRSFVQSIGDRDDRAITKVIIDLAHTLGMTTVAEGVETRMQMEVLHALDCDMAQGFLFHHPVPGSQIDMSPVDFTTVDERCSEPEPQRLQPL